jgi:ribonuclease BN (tRNA processing enzyme)
MIQRIFHTIGQGAFYSERHENINIVFDCGTEWQNRTKSIFNKVITQSFEKNEIIDILFISHFDYDHISKIETLKKQVKKIERVVLPLLHEDEKILLSNFYGALDLNILTLINSPVEYFGKETKIIYVRQSEDTESAINESIEPQNLDDIPSPDDKNSIEIESGTKIKITGLKNWLFIPFNGNYIKNHKELISELTKEGFDVEKLSNDSDYTLNKIVKDLSISKADGGKKLQQIYDRLNGKINQNSMFLYSGPITNNKYYKYCFVGHPQKHFYNYSIYHNRFNKVGCIYTGDGDLNIVDIKSIYKNYWRNVGTIQIPHHGDIKSFNKKVLKDQFYSCPMSVGKTNNYSHPSSKVIAEILSSRSSPILVTEELDSMYIEIIK